MHILTEIGEIGLEYQGREYRLRPSLAAMARIGTPAEIVEVFGLVLGGPPEPTGNPVLDRPRWRAWGREQFRAALSVLHACCDDDLSPLIGWTTERMTYRPGAMPAANITVLARELLRHGVIGDVPTDPRQPKRGKFSPEFHARDFAALAMAHLGLSEAEAWQMTMTSFILAMRAKFPPPETPTKDDAPSEEAHDATMAWLAAVNAKRVAANG